MGNINGKHIAVIINSFNRLDLLKESLSSLVNEFKKTSLKFSVFIFEAGSSDGSIEWINTFCAMNSEVNIHTIIANPGEDTSFSAGVNKACGFAIEKFSSIDYIFLYETDNFLRSLDPVIKSVELLYENKDIAACGYTVRKHDGGMAGFGASFPSLISFALGKQFSFFLKLEAPKTVWYQRVLGTYSYCDIVYTSPLLIRKEVWKELNGFDSETFPFSDCDIDLAYRIKKLGYKMAVLQSEDVIHDNLQIQSSWSETRTIRDYKARMKYFKKHYGVIVHLIKPFLFLTHTLEFNLLLFFNLIGKRKTGSLKTRWFLMKKVFTNYE